jgi:hypothetical protein
MTGAIPKKARHATVREELADVLTERAGWTYARLRAGRSHDVEPHEETITQDLLLDISTMLPDTEVKAFTRQEEAGNGADWYWDWWFQGQGWFGLRVQAKRLKKRKKGKPCYDLGYKVGAPPKKRQVDLLLDSAREDGVQAAYVLYNGPDLDMSLFTWGCRRLPASPAFFGVSILPATIARDLVDARPHTRTVPLATAGGYSRPWSCVITCDPSTGCDWRWPLTPRPLGFDISDLAWWAARSYFRIVAQTRPRPERDAEQEPPLDPDVLATESLRDQPEAYVATLLADPAQADAELPKKVRALTVFRSPTTP